MGCGKFNRANTEDYVIVDISGWQNQLSLRETEMLEWLEKFDHPSWFAWERPRKTMLFQDVKMAELFVLTWS